MANFLNIHREGAILVLTMDQPDTRDMLAGNTAVQEIVDACTMIAADVSVRAVILTGAGSVFSSGENVRDMQKYERDTPPPETACQEYRSGIQRVPKALYHLEVPVIAAINGPAIGAGLDLACMCDIRIASASATFAESFLTAGIVPGDAGAWLLPRVVGRAKAAEMAFFGEPVSSAEALECGLVSRVVEPEALMDTALNVAARIAANPGAVLRMTKRLLRGAEHGSLESSLELAANLQAIAHMDPGHHEAVRAFAEKRPPKFRH
ncbi:Short-chain-enoyl-CoA hydratase [Paraburkholderia sediminicola]|uniref:Short-chain-enoyl-CoA hydratase n=1 Tax=Paraburkholderia sediminicola TaxID=458836 RepID=A0A6J5CXE0_9BURK|nr:crotonase/enoyl-CoA hydratase family protein [Paraburkholderia sediminicola]CAB3745577.1 Short-chain-enoyl-CoA hydratase [Paraburkholderia sediminicola]